MLKLTLVSINGRPRFIRLPVAHDGRVQVTLAQLRQYWNIRRGDAIHF